VFAPPVQRAADAKVKDKYDLAMRMLDFPNTPRAQLEPQPWALPNVASYLCFNWKMRDAFIYSETLVDAIINDKGAFKDIWDNLRTDPNGPMIDIFKELLDHLAPRATLLSDVAVPVDLKSERIMALVEVTNPAIVTKTLVKAFSKDPQAKARLYKDVTIWEILQGQELAADETELMIEGVGFVSTEAPKEGDKAKEKGAPNNATLPNMAITVFKDYLIVSTHVDFITEFIDHHAAGAGLGGEADYGRVRDALVKLGSKDDSFHFFSRTDESYRATYELLKQGKLPESETMLARLLNAITGPKEDGAIRKQEIDGSKLPEFEKVQKYLGPGGLFAQTDDNGWWLVGCLLKK
jgi:hypothetical protein